MEISTESESVLRLVRSLKVIRLDWQEIANV